MSKRIAFFCLTALLLLGGMGVYFETSINAAGAGCCGGPTRLGYPAAPPPGAPARMRSEVRFFGGDRLEAGTLRADRSGMETPRRASESTAVSLLLLAVGLAMLVHLITGPAVQGIGRSALSVGVFGLALAVGLARMPINPPTPGATLKTAPTPQAQLDDIPDFEATLEIGGNGLTQIGGTALDRDGNLYVTGGFKDSVYFSTSPLPTRLTATRDFDVFIAKYSPGRKCLWARQANGSVAAPDGLSLEGGLTIAVDGRGNCYVGGAFVSSLSFKDENDAEKAKLSADGDGLNLEPFIAKYSPAGALIWARGGNSGSPQAPDELTSGLNSIFDMAIDREGNPFVLSNFSGVRFLGQPVSRTGKLNVVTARLNPETGTPVWVSPVGGVDEMGGTAISLDNAANAYVVGHFRNGTITFPTQPNPTALNSPEKKSNTFVAKYSKDGTCLLVKHVKGEVVGYDIAAGSAGEFFVTGGYIAEAVFDSVTVQSTAIAASGFLAKYAADGTLAFVRDFGRTDHTLGSRVAVDAAGTAYVVGNVRGEAVFGGEGPNATTLASDDANMFLAAYNAAGQLEFVKPLNGTNSLSQNFFSQMDLLVEPIGLTIDLAGGRLLVSGDFGGKLKLEDNLGLDSEDRDFDGDGGEDGTDFDGDGDNDGDDGDDDGRFSGTPNQTLPDRNGFIGFIPFTTVPIDPPTAKLTFPKGGETFNSGDTINIAWTSSDKIAVTSHDLALSIDGGKDFAQGIAVGLPGTLQNFAYKIPGNLKTDAARIRLTAGNAAGKTAQDTTPADFKIALPPDADTEKPVVTVTAPAAGLTVMSLDGATVNAAWRSTDNKGVASHTVRLTGKRGGTNFTQTVVSGLPGTAASLTISIAKNDTVTDAQVVVEARDAAGNVGQGRSGLFTIAAPPADTQKPVVSNVSLSKSSVKRKKDPNVVVSWNSTDDTGVTTHDLSFAADGSNFSTSVVVGLPGTARTFTWAIPSSVPKTKTGAVKVTARDAVGNSGEASSGPLSIK